MRWVRRAHFRTDVCLLQHLFVASLAYDRVHIAGYEMQSHQVDLWCPFTLGGLRERRFIGLLPRSGDIRD
jgi:hypothetical protein